MKRVASLLAASNSDPLKSNIGPPWVGFNPAKRNTQKLETGYPFLDKLPLAASCQLPVGSNSDSSSLYNLLKLKPIDTMKFFVFTGVKPRLMSQPEFFICPPLIDLLDTPFSKGTSRAITISVVFL